MPLKTCCYPGCCARAALAVSEYNTDETYPCLCVAHWNQLRTAEPERMAQFVNIRYVHRSRCSVAA
jgi:hypothetical protein